MIEVKKFSGVLNTDDAVAEVLPTEHIDARNVVFRGEGDNKRIQNVVGTTLIANSYLPATGTNRRIGDFYDDVRQRIYWFNWNSGGKNGFYYYDIKTATVVSVIVCFTNTDTDIFEFDLDRPIASINIIYGDDDIVYFADSLKRPTYINVNKVIAGDYGQIKREFINVAKAPAIMPPEVVYENDTSVTINNLQNALFKFCYRYVYLNNEKPVWSSGSEVPLPYKSITALASSSTSDNARIAVYLQTGDVDVKEIEVAVKQTTAGGTSNWLRVTSLNKTDLSIPDNSIYRFVFYNDGLYTTIPTEGNDPNLQELQGQDYVPRETNSQELLNGNVIIYAGILEGYDKPTPTLSNTISVAHHYYNRYNGLLFFGFQNAAKQITLFLTGVGTLPTLSNSLAKFFVSVKDSAEVDKSFNYDNLTASTSITTIFDAIVSAATAKGFSEVSRSSDRIVLSHANNLVLSSAYYNYVTGSMVQQSRFALSPDARYSFVAAYYDAQGRNVATIHAKEWDVNTGSFNSATSSAQEYVPKVTLTLSHRPPIEAAYYHIGRTNDLTYNKRFFWVSKDARSDDIAISSITNTRYAYVDISNVDLYNELGFGDAAIGVDISKGDKIRFMGRFASISTLTFYSAYKEYEIINIKTDPFINGKKYVGRYIQFEYPSADIGADITFDGSNGYLNYYVFIYSPKKHTDTNETVFFEFGKRLGIGNAGEADCFHLGLEQTQTSDLVTPAKITISDGDLFFRYRNVPVGGSYFGNHQNYNFNFGMPITGGNSVSPITVVPVTIQDTTITTPTGTIKDQEFKDAGTGVSDYPTSSDTACFYQNTTSSTIKIRVRCTITFDTDEDLHMRPLVKLVNNPVPVASVVIDYLTPPILVGKDAGVVTYEVDDYIDVYAGSKAFLLLSKTITVSNAIVTISDFRIDILAAISIPVFETTYSDNLQLRANSISRPLIIDDNAKETYNSTLRRWSLAYQQGTNINQTNRFYPSNFAETDKAKGDIQAMAVFGDLLITVQNRGVCSDGIYRKFIKNSSGEASLIITNDIITANNSNYYKGEYGCGDQYTGIVKSSNAIYFVDPVRGYQIRASLNGLEPINETWKGQYYIRGLLTPYNKTWVRTDGGTARIHGYFDYLENQYVCILEGGTLSGNTISSYALAFQERSAGNPSYTGFFDYYVDGMICAEEVTYSWKDGLFYIHDNTTTYNKFHGTQYNAYITVPFNENIFEKKLFQSLAQQGSEAWGCPVIYTDVESYSGQRQESNLIATDFKLSTGKYQSAFKRDIYSAGASPLINGNKLKGSFIVVKFQKASASNFVYLSIVSILYDSQHLTPK